MTDDNSPDNSLGRPASHLWFPNRPAVAALRTEWERRQRENGNNCADWPVWLQPFVERLLAALEAPPEDMAAFDRAEFDELLREVVALREWKAAHEAAAFREAGPPPPRLSDAITEWFRVALSECPEWLLKHGASAGALDLMRHLQQSGALVGVRGEAGPLPSELNIELGEGRKGDPSGTIV